MKKLLTTRLVLLAIFLCLFSVVFHQISSVEKVHAAINNTINFQSKIVNKTTGLNISAGSPACVAAGADTCDFRVRIWNQLSGGTATAGNNLMYEELFTNIEIGDANGIFNLNINSVCGATTSGDHHWGTTGASATVCNLIDDNDSGSVTGVSFDRSDLFLEITFDPSGAWTDLASPPGGIETFTRTALRSVPSAFSAQTLSGIAASGFVQLAPGAAQTTGNTSNSLIWLNENGSGTPNLLEIEVGGVDALVLNNAGQLQLTTQGNTGGLLIGGDASLYRSAVNTLRTPGTLIVDSTIGIGTTTPGRSLDVAGVASINNNLLGQIDGGSLFGRIVLSQNQLVLDPASLWSSSTARDSTRNWTEIAINSDGKYMIAVGDITNIYTSSDYGVTWTARESARGWYGVAISADGKYQTASAYSEQIYTSSDYGVTWTARDSNRNWERMAMSADGKYQAATVNNGLIYISSDYGVTWTSTAASRDWISITMSSDGKYLSAAGGSMNIYTSSDYGATWTARDSSRNWQGISMSADGRYQAAPAQSGQIYVSSDYGVTWTARDSNRNWNGVAVSGNGKFQTANVYGGQIYVSSDYGVTWAAKDSSRDWYNVAMSADGRYQAGTEQSGNIYVSTTGSFIDGGFAAGGLGTGGGAARDFVVDPTTKTVYVGRLSNTAADTSIFVVRDRTGTVKMNINSSGNNHSYVSGFNAGFGFAVGTSTATARLDVLVASGDGTTKAFAVGKGTTNYLTILNGGGIGINTAGTVGSGLILDINGNTRVQGSLALGTASNDVLGIASSGGSPTNSLYWGNLRICLENGTNCPASSDATLTNKSGGTLSAGALVIYDTANDSSITTTTTANNTKVAGVVQSSCLNNASCTVRVVGITTVTSSVAVSRGNYIYTSTTAGEAKVGTTATDLGVIGVALTEDLSAPYSVSMLIVKDISTVDIASLVQLAPSSTQTTTSTNSLINLTSTATGSTNALIKVNENGSGTPNLLELEVGGTDKFVVDNNGNVGVGGAAPTSTAGITVNQFYAGSSTFYGTYSAATIIGASTGLTNGVLGLSVANPGLGNTVLGVVGVQGSSGLSGAGTLTSSVGLYGSAGNLGTGTVTSAYGAFIAAGSNSGGGTLTDNYGILITSQTAGTNDYGLYIQGADTAALYVASGATNLGGSLTVGSGGNTLTTTGGGEPILAGTARHNRTLALNPEYPGAVLSRFYGGGTDTLFTGTLTSDTDTSGNLLRNYYEWTSSQASLNYYTVAVRVKLPADFDGWQTTNAIQVDILTTTTSNADNVVDVRIYNADDTPGTIVYGITGNVSGSANTWQTVTFDDSNIDDGGAPDWDAPGETAVIYLRMGAKSSNIVHIGDIRLNYLSKF